MTHLPELVAFSLSVLFGNFVYFAFCSSVTSPRFWKEGFSFLLITSPITCTATYVVLCLRKINSSSPSFSAANYYCKLKLQAILTLTLMLSANLCGCLLLYLMLFFLSMFSSKSKRGD